MKTAISIPDEVFARAEQVARSKGFTRSELFTRAIIFYIENGASTEEAKIEKINRLVEEMGSDPLVITEYGRGALNRLVDEGW